MTPYNVTEITAIRMREAQAIKDSLEAHNEIARLRAAIRKINEAKDDPRVLKHMIDDAMKIVNKPQRRV